MKIAFVTCLSYPDVSPSDQLCADILTAQGHLVEPAPWNNLQVDWQRYDIVILRSCWDYYDYIELFIGFLDRLANEGCSVFNSVKIVKWNLHKRYLQDLSLDSIRIPKTIFFSRGQQINDLSTHLEQAGWSNDWQKLVMKPCISASGRGVELIHQHEASEASQRLNDLLQQEDIMLQEYMPEVAAHGEVSYVFFKGVFSHAILKEVNKDTNAEEFRINTQYKGKNSSLAPDDSVLTSTKRVVDTIAKQFNEVPLYARVDGVNRDGEFILMECELIEPGLFLNFTQDGAQNFAQAINDR